MLHFIHNNGISKFLNLYRLDVTAAKNKSGSVKFALLPLSVIEAEIGSGNRSAAHPNIN